MSLLQLQVRPGQEALQQECLNKAHSTSHAWTLCCRGVCVSHSPLGTTHDEASKLHATTCAFATEETSYSRPSIPQKSSETRPQLTVTGGGGGARRALELVNKGAALQGVLAQVLLDRVQPRRHHLAAGIALAQVRRLQRACRHMSLWVSHRSPHPANCLSTQNMLKLHRSPSPQVVMACKQQSRNETGPLVKLYYSFSSFAFNISLDCM